MRIGFALLVSVQAFAAPPALDSASLNQKLEQILTRTVGTQLAAEKTGFEIRILNASDGATVAEASHAGDKFIYPASTIKILVASSTYRRRDQGLLRLDDKVTITQRNAADECRIEGTCDRLGPGKKPTVARLLEDMLTISSNIATNQLIDVLTKEGINADADAWGFATLKIYRKLYAVTPAEDPMPEARNTATAGDLASLYAALAWAPSGFLSESSRADFLARLRRQRHNDRLNRHFPADVFFFHKPGNTSQVTGDAGYFLHTGADGKSYIVVMSGLLDFARYPKNGQSTSAYRALAEIGRDLLAVVKAGLR